MVPLTRSRWRHYAALNAYWFSASYKWFILMLAVLPGQVQQIAPESKNSSWGMIVTIGSAWAVIGAALFGDWCDRIGHRARFMIVGGLLTCGSLFALANATSLLWLSIGFLALQISDGIIFGPYSGLIPETVAPDERGYASGIMSLLKLCGQLVSGGLAILLKEPRLIYGGIIVTVLLSIPITLRTFESGGKSQVKGPKLFAGFFSPWKDRDFRLTWTVRLLAAFGAGSVQTYLRNLIEDTYARRNTVEVVFGTGGLTPAQAVSLLGLTIALMGAIGAIVAAKYVDRVGRKRMLCGAGLTVMVVLLGFAVARHMNIALGLAAIFGIAFGTYLSAEWALASDVMPNPESLSRDMGLWQSSTPLGQLLAGGLGPLVDWGNQFGDYQGYRGIALAASVLFLIAAFLVLQVRGSR